MIIRIIHGQCSKVVNPDTKEQLNDDISVYMDIINCPTGYRFMAHLMCIIREEKFYFEYKRQYQPVFCIDLNNNPKFSVVIRDGSTTIIRRYLSTKNALLLLSLIPWDKVNHKNWQVESEITKLKFLVTNVTIHKNEDIKCVVKIICTLFDNRVIQLFSDKKI